MTSSSDSLFALTRRGMLMSLALPILPVAIVLAVASGALPVHTKNFAVVEGLWGATVLCSTGAAAATMRGMALQRPKSVRVWMIALAAVNACTGAGLVLHAWARRFG